jgi:hypothetical protein
VIASCTRTAMVPSSARNTSTERCPAATASSVHPHSDSARISSRHQRRPHRPGLDRRVDEDRSTAELVSQAVLKHAVEVVAHPGRCVPRPGSAVAEEYVELIALEQWYQSGMSGRIRHVPIIAALERAVTQHSTER